MNNEFLNTLLSVYRNSGSDFSGIGLILYKDLSKIPIYPLSLKKLDYSTESLVEKLIHISTLSSEFHDGFHLISNDLKLTHISQYFSPPIVTEAHVNHSKTIGGRYMAALFGSHIEGVELTGIATTTNGIVIFQNGIEIYSKGEK